MLFINWLPPVPYSVAGLDGATVKKGVKAVSLLQTPLNRRYQSKLPFVFVRAYSVTGVVGATTIRMMDFANSASLAEIQLAPVSALR